MESGIYALDLKNQIRTGMTLQFIEPDTPFIQDSGFSLLDEQMQSIAQADHGKVQFLKTDKQLKKGSIIRRETMVK
ncbi:hypothetical protein SDC9_168286 [bioreactor metagenome]|uniref:Peptidase family U32 C-terminal domain-containing protein n=1 Tax=bioreactor metagenome TaxID=1076179 RepID=A0A645G232_9ZZZZ